MREQGREGAVDVGRLEGRCPHQAGGHGPGAHPNLRPRRPHRSGGTSYCLTAAPALFGRRLMDHRGRGRSSGRSSLSVSSHPGPLGPRASQKGAGPSRLLVTPAVSLRLPPGAQGLYPVGLPQCSYCSARSRGSLEALWLRLGICPGGLGSITLWPPRPAPDL